MKNIMSKETRDEHVKSFCNSYYAKPYVEANTLKFITFFDAHPAATPLSLDSFFLPAFCELLGSGSHLQHSEKITLPQIMDQLLGYALFRSAQKEQKPTEGNTAIFLTHKVLKDRYKHELFFCEMIAFYRENDPHADARQGVVAHFVKLKLSMNELVLNNFSFFNSKETLFADPLWQKFFLARYISHSFQLQSQDAQFKALEHWISQNRHHEKHLQVWQFATWLMLANSAYEPLKAFHRTLLLNTKEDDEHSAAIYKACFVSVSQYMETHSLTDSGAPSSLAALTAMLSHVENNDCDREYNASPLMKVFRFTLPDEKAGNNSSASSAKPK